MSGRRADANGLTIIAFLTFWFVQRQAAAMARRTDFLFKQRVTHPRASMLQARQPPLAPT